MVYFSHEFHYLISQHFYLGLGDLQVFICIWTEQFTVACAAYLTELQAVTCVFLALAHGYNITSLHVTVKSY